MANATYTLTANAAAMVDENAPDTNLSGAQVYDLAPSDSSASYTGRYLLLDFPSFPAAFAYNRLYSAFLTVKLGTVLLLTSPQTLQGFDIPHFDAQTITWNTKPVIPLAPPQSREIYNYYSDQTALFIHANGNDGQNAKSLLQRGAALVKASISQPASATIEIYGGADGNWPILTVSYDDAELVTTAVAKENGPVGTFEDRTQPITFAWSYSKIGNYFCVADHYQVNATLYWRNGEIGEWSAVSPESASALSLTILGNTFPLSNLIQWYVEGTDSAGATTRTPVYSFRTSDYETYADALSPKNSIEDGSGPIVFRWSTSNQSGSSPTGADLQYNAGSGWVDFASVANTNAKTYTAPANTFPAGSIQWRVRAYNADGVAGSWSSPASFVNYAAPDEPTGVYCEPTPFTAVIWQAADQQAYRITVDGTVYGPFFGTDKRFELPEYLQDGEHTVTVEVQNAFGLWSQPGSYSFTVANVPGAAVTLSGSFDTDAALSWVTASSTADYLIYRDGVRIGHTAGLSFLDRLAVGPHSYTILNRLPAGNYTMSNTVTGAMVPESTMIAPLDGSSGWLSLRLTDRTETTQEYNYSRTRSLRHFAGSPWPVLELSPYEDDSVSLAVAFAEDAEAKAFEQLRGKPVILKLRGPRLLVGGLVTLSTIHGDFYRSYAFTVQRCHYEDYVDDDA